LNSINASRSASSSSNSEYRTGTSAFSNHGAKTPKHHNAGIKVSTPVSVIVMSVTETDSVSVSVQIPDRVVESVAEELREGDVEPSPETVRDRVFDRVLVEHELVDETERRVVESVADRVDA
jgi:hypothetical protein